MVELSCHGGQLAPARLLAALHAAGARPAAPGEFTRRAVLNGKLDLVQAEAVGDLIDATAPAQARAALAPARRRAVAAGSRSCASALVDAQALLSYEIDFPGEDDGPVPPAADRRRRSTTRRARIGRLLATAPSAERMRQGALLVLAGPAQRRQVLALQRAARHRAGAGHRDPRHDPRRHRGATPTSSAGRCGWRTPPGSGMPGDRMERMGVEVSRRYLAAADLVLLCVEAGRDPGPDEARHHRRAADARWCAPSATWCAEPARGLAVSAVTGEGIEDLRRTVAERVFGDRIALGDLEPTLSRERHRTALLRAEAALAEAAAQLGPVGDAVLASHHVREATLALDELVGRGGHRGGAGEGVRGFCVGK